MKDSLNFINFGHWSNSVHHEAKAIASLKKAPTTKPLNINEENQSGKFKGSKGEIYNTTLDSCTCFAFAGSRPCKHIYGLALRLGLIDLDDCDPYTMSQKEIDDIVNDPNPEVRVRKAGKLSSDQQREMLIRILSK